MTVNVKLVRQNKNIRNKKRKKNIRNRIMAELKNKIMAGASRRNQDNSQDKEQLIHMSNTRCSVSSMLVCLY